MFVLRWYRGLVLSVDATSAEVFFVDYGDTEWVLNSSVKPIHQSLLQVLTTNQVIIFCSFQNIIVRQLPEPLNHDKKSSIVSQKYELG